MVSNGSFATGDFTGWNGVAVPAEFTVVAKGGTGAQASCPTPFMLKLAFNAADRTLSNERFPAKEGDHVTASFQYAALSGSFTPRLLLRWLDAGGAQIGAVATQSPGSVAAASWAGFTSPSTRPGAGRHRLRPGRRGPRRRRLRQWPRHRHRRPQGRHRGAGPAHHHRGGGELSASGAIGSLTTTINASFGSKEAFVSQASAAIARVDSLASTWVMRQKAGAATASSRPSPSPARTASAISTLRWAYDHIDLDGRVSARDLVIDDSTNLVPDSQLQTTGIWPVSGEWSLIPTSTLTNARSIGEIRFDRAGASGFATLTATRSFPVSDDASYTVTFRSRGDGSAYGSYAIIQWLNAAGSRGRHQHHRRGVDHQRQHGAACQSDGHPGSRRRGGPLALHGQPRHHHLGLCPVLRAERPPAEPVGRDRRWRDHRREGQLHRPRRARAPRSAPARSPARSTSPTAWC